MHLFVGRSVTVQYNAADMRSPCAYAASVRMSSRQRSAWAGVGTIGLSRTTLIPVSRTFRCEKDGGACAEVCERGSVFVEPWLQHALRTQLRLSRRVRRLPHAESASQAPFRKTESRDVRAC